MYEKNKLLHFQDDSVKEGVINSQGRVDLFKIIIKTGKDYRGFRSVDILKPLKVKIHDQKMVVVDGNHRLMAYKQLGIELIPIIYMSTEL